MLLLMVHINMQEIRVSKDTLLRTNKTGNFAKRYRKVTFDFKQFENAILKQCSIRAQKYKGYQRITLTKGYAHVLWKKLYIYKRHLKDIQMMMYS